MHSIFGNCSLSKSKKNKKKTLAYILEIKGGKRLSCWKNAFFSWKSHNVLI